MNLFGADTNILVRFLVRDIESQAKRVLVLLDEGHVLYINEVVLTELYWVLTRVYKYPKNSFVAVLDMLLESNGFQLFHPEIVRNALSDYIHNAAEFPDCLIHQINLNKEMKTLTFDKKIGRVKQHGFAQRINVINIQNPTIHRKISDSKERDID